MWMGVLPPHPIEAKRKRRFPRNVSSIHFGVCVMYEFQKPMGFLTYPEFTLGIWAKRALLIVDAVNCGFRESSGGMNRTFQMVVFGEILAPWAGNGVHFLRSIQPISEKTHHAPACDKQQSPSCDEAHRYYQRLNQMNEPNQCPDNPFDDRVHHQNPLKRVSWVREFRRVRCKWLCTWPDKCDACILSFCLDTWEPLYILLRLHFVTNREIAAE